MARILVIEDEPPIRRVLQKQLRAHGHEVVLAATGEEGLDAATEAKPDVILVDMALPDMAGTDLLRRIFAIDSLRRVPVIVLSGKADEIDRVVSFELGAADFVAKPFSVRELVLRVEAILRRAGARIADQRVRLGRLAIDREAYRAWVDDSEIELTLLEFRLLQAFIDQNGRVLARSSLLDGVWGGDVSITSRTLDTHVNRLRDKLGACASYLETVRGVGYRFVVRDEAHRDDGTELH